VSRLEHSPASTALKAIVQYRAIDPVSSSTMRISACWVPSLESVVPTLTEEGRAMMVAPPVLQRNHIRSKRAAWLQNVSSDEDRDPRVSCGNTGLNLADAKRRDFAQNITAWAKPSDNRLSRRCWRAKFQRPPAGPRAPSRQCRASTHLSACPKSRSVGRVWVSNCSRGVALNVFPNICQRASAP